MRKIALCALAVLVLLIAAPGATHAQGCAPGAFQQFDMAGVYVDPASPMRVEVYSCGGVYVQWDNLYGRHDAGYGSTNRIPGGGVAATVLPVSAISLDDSRRIAFKPAEPGYIQVITFGVYDDSVRIYRLRKIA